MLNYFSKLIIFISITIIFIPNYSISECNIHLIPKEYFIKNEKLTELIDNLGIEVFDDEFGYQEKYNLYKVDSYSQHGVKNTNYSKYDDVILHYCCDKNTPIVSGNKGGVTVIETEENNLKLFRIFYTFDVFEKIENRIAADDEILSKFEKKYGKIPYFKYKNKYLSISIAPYEPVNCALNENHDIELPNIVYIYSITDYTPLIVDIEKKKNLHPVKKY